MNPLDPIATFRLALVAAWLFSAGLASAETLTGKVIGVTDGDTITVLDAAHEQHKIRLAGIDAPEKAQPFGQRSKAQMSDLVFDKPVTVEWSKHDRYQRIIGKVLVADRDAGLALVSAGLAWHYKRYQKEQTPDDQARYAAAEDAARARRAGLWVDANPVPPWDWRAARRYSPSGTSPTPTPAEVQKGRL